MVKQPKPFEPSKTMPRHLIAGFGIRYGHDLSLAVSIDTDPNKIKLFRDGGERDGAMQAAWGLSQQPGFMACPRTCLARQKQREGVCAHARATLCLEHRKGLLHHASCEGAPCTRSHPSDPLHVSASCQPPPATEIRSTESASVRPSPSFEADVDPYAVS